MTDVAVDEMRGMTLLNEMGDIEIAWDSAHDNDMRAVIQKKMDEGVRFFILKPMLGSVLFRKSALKTMTDLKENRVKIADADLEKMFSAGKIAVFRNNSGATVETAGIAKTAEQASRARTVAVRPMQGG